MPPVALDAMGGDHAPDVTVAGALKARREHGLDIVLVGDPQVLGPRLEAHGGRREAHEIEIVAASEVIAMDEDPALALRAKRDASIRVAAELVASGQASALVSAGSTGATLAAALLALGRLRGIRRPAVGAVLPVDTGGVVLVDAGGTADATAQMMTMFAAMGTAYARVLGVERPRLGLLNVGAEPAKGNALAREAFELLSAMEGFTGNVEPDAVLAGRVDVVISDGFTGNVFLKTLEGLASPKLSVDGGPGAALLLGVDGEVLVAHGDADENAIAAALRTATTVAGAKLAQRVAQRLAELPGGG